jgi:hypothetical protein
VVVVLAGVVVLSSILLYWVGYIRDERIRKLRWPKMLSSSKIAVLTHIYFRGHGWSLEQPKDQFLYHFIANKGPLRFFLSCVDGTLVKSGTLSRFLERLESNASQLRGLHGLPLVVITDVQLTDALRELLHTRGLIVFHFKELHLVRDLAEIMPDQLCTVDQRQLRIIANSPRAVGRFIDVSIEKKNWPVAIHMASIAAAVDAADSHAGARLEHIKRMAEKEAIK